MECCSHIWGGALETGGIDLLIEYINALLNGPVFGFDPFSHKLVF